MTFFKTIHYAYHVREVKLRKFIYFDSCLRFFNIVSSLFCFLVYLVVSFWFFSLCSISEISFFWFLHGIFDLTRLIISQFCFQKFMVWFQSRCFSKWDLLIFQTMLSISKIYTHLIPPRETAYIVTAKKKKKKKSGIKYSRIKRKKSMDPRFESQAYWFSFSRNRLRIYRAYTVWQYFHLFLCDTQRNFSKQKLQQNLICKNWLNYNVRYNIV